MPGNSGNKSNKPKLHGSTNSLRDTFNQALNEATTAEQARSKANSGEGHSTKSSNTNFAELKEWYAKLDQDTRSAIDKAADKPTSRFTNEERDSFYLKVDPYHYNQYLQFRYPGKTEYIQSRMHSYYGFRRHLEENGVAPKKPSETNPETQYAEQVAKEQVNRGEAPKDKSIFDIVQDEAKAENSKSASQPTANPEKVTPEKQAAQDMVETSKEMPKEEKPSKNESIDDVWAKALNEEWHRKYDVDWNNPEAVQNAKENAFKTNDYTSYRSLSDEQIRQLYPDPKEAEALINGKYESAKHKNNPDYDDNYLRYSLMDDTSTYPNYGFPVPVGEVVPPARAKFNKKETVQEPSVQEPPREPLKNNVTIWDSPPMPSELPKKLKSNNPFLLIDPAEFKKTFGDGSIDLNTPYGWSPYPYVKGRGISYNAAQPLSTAQKIVAGLGLGALGGIYGLGHLMNDSQQTQVPYRMEPEPANEAVVQPEPTLEQQFVLQSTSPFDYAKAANLFDLYDRYGSSDSIDNSIPEEQSADENTLQPDSDTYKNAQEIGQRIASRTGYAPELKEDNFELPQNPPKVGSNIKTAGLKSPNGGEVPQELSKLSGVKPKVIKDTSKGPIVLNDPNHRKTKDVQNNSITPERAAASQMVNQYAGIPAEVVRAKNQPFLTTDAIWNRLRQKGLVSPEEGIRSGLFTPDEVRYITENDLWRYR